MDDSLHSPDAREQLFGWLRFMVEHKASDLFLTSGFPAAVKLDGKIQKIEQETLSAEKCTEIAVSIMNTKQIEEFMSTNECNFAIQLPGSARFRVNAMVQRGATALVLRI